MGERVTVLLSGGVDSAACVAFYARRKARVGAIFVDYGQAARLAEAKAAKAIARHYGVALRKIEVNARRRWGAGVVPGRNALLVSCGLMLLETGSQSLVLGIHSGTNYPDCSPPFVRGMQAIADLYSDGQVQIGAPFLSMTKADIAQFCFARGVPIRLTHSCEAGSRPCGRCLSCRDRGVIDAA
jgi:7-cyano-7-deazaguanine synthase